MHPDRIDRTTTPAALLLLVMTTDTSSGKCNCIAFAFSGDRRSIGYPAFGRGW